MNGYVCFFERKRIEVRANTLYEAKVKAIQEFRVAKSKEHLVIAELAELNGKPYIHTAVN